MSKTNGTPKFLSTSSTLSNLAVSGKSNGGLPVGSYILFVGDTDSGKSFFSKAFLAEASINKAFDGYQLILDDVERADRIDTEKFFGKKLMSRIQPPKKNKEGEPVYSETVEDLYENVEDAIKRGPCIYVCDSETSLTCRADQKKANKRDDQKGSYGVDKAKLHSTNLRRLMGPLQESGSILILINQTRDRIGFGAQFDPKTRAGGRALAFYATVQMWTSVREKIKRTIKGKKRQVGIVARIRVKRSRVTGKDRTVDVPIYWSSGIDDLGGMVHWLVDEKHWEGAKEVDGKVKAPEFKFEGSKEGLIKKIEAEGLERELKALTAEVWSDIETACTVERKSRYA